eukprot:TRINITY_DN7065_c0_g1_i2.p1 TRINITY_DN7065_c0_g1~~TRINITY_DN7065_c0_g1_i2.p1  ORF type:complete len:1458 (+),score=398.06 TRINITY_DN7065_c0_g1_i2:97-4470(+)
MSRHRVKLFDGRKVYIHPHFPIAEYNELKSVLQQNGATLLGEVKPGKCTVIVRSFDENGDFGTYARVPEQIIFSAEFIHECVRKGHKLDQVNPGAQWTSLALAGKVICCTGIAHDDRERIRKLVTWMSGSYCPDFTDLITHLISLSTHTEKYRVAKSFGAIVVRPDWVEECWKARAALDVSGFLIATFSGCTVSATGLSNVLKSKLERDIVMHGGKFEKDLSKKCTHLITNVPEGKKYMGAKKWGIPVVTLKWVEASIEAKSPRNTEEFAVEDPEPLNQNVTKAFLDSEVSNASDTAGNNSIEPPPDDRRWEPQQPPVEDGEDFDPEMALDGCTVFFSGFPAEREQHLFNLARDCGATRYAKIDRRITHFVVDRVNEANLQQLSNCFAGASNLPKIVGSKWLEECHERRRRVPEDPYVRDLPPYLFDRESSEVPCTAEPRRKDTTKKNAAHLSDDSNKENHGGNPRRTSRDQHRDHRDGDSSLPSSQNGALASKPSQLLFNQKNFLVRNGFLEEEISILRKILSEMGALRFDEDEDSNELPPEFVHYVLVCHGFKGISSRDLLKKKSAQTPPKIVSLEWLVRCHDERRLFNPEDTPLFSPLPCRPPFADMQALNISVTGFVEDERKNVTQLIQLLGAKFTETLTKNNNLLISKERKGMKYGFAKKNRIPVQTAEWLHQMALRKTEDPPLPLAIRDSRLLNSTQTSSQVSKLPSYHDLSHDEDDRDSRSPIFAGVTVCCSRKIPEKRQNDLREMVTAMGGSFVSATNAGTTHLLHEGRAETIKELKKGGPIAVSPVWVERCHTLWKKLPEADYPPTINPKMNLGLEVTSPQLEKATPKRPRPEPVERPPESAKKARVTPKKQEKSETWDMAVKNQAKKSQLIHDERHFLALKNAKDPETDVPLMDRIKNKLTTPEKENKGEDTGKIKAEHATDPMDLDLESPPPKRNAGIAKDAPRTFVPCTQQSDMSATEPMITETSTEKTSVLDNSKANIDSHDDEEDHVLSVSSKEEEEDARKVSPSQTSTQKDRDESDRLQQQVAEFFKVFDSNFVPEKKGPPQISFEPKGKKRRQNSKVLKKRVTDDSPVRRRTDSPGRTPKKESDTTSDEEKSANEDEEDVVDNSQIVRYVHHGEQSGRLKIRQRLRSAAGDFGPENAETSNDESTLQPVPSFRNDPPTFRTGATAQSAEFRNATIPSDVAKAPLRTSNSSAHQNEITDSPFAYESGSSSQQPKEPSQPKLPKVYKILISNIGTEHGKFRELRRTVEKLGGTLFRDWVAGITHVVSWPPFIASHKIWGGMAIGAWVLKPSFLTESAKVGHFVDEESHQFTNEEAVKSEQVRMVEASHVCRVVLQQQRERKGPTPGFFAGMRIVAILDGKEEGWREILRMAGGHIYLVTSVTAAEEIARKEKGITHFFCDEKRLRSHKEQPFSDSKVQVWNLTTMREFILNCGKLPVNMKGSR